MSRRGVVAIECNVEKVASVAFKVVWNVEKIVRAALKVVASASQLGEASPRRRGAQARRSAPDPEPRSDVSELRLVGPTGRCNRATASRDGRGTQCGDVVKVRCVQPVIGCDVSRAR
jgi:hypothetical protein